MSTLLIDADILCYAVCCEQLEETKEPDGCWTYRLSEDGAMAEVDIRVESLMKETGAEDSILCIGAKGNFRKRDVDRSYKSNREGKKKPLGYFAVMDRIREDYETAEYPWLEADDTLGILHTRRGADTIIVSNDKDMRTIPGRLYNHVTQEMVEISKADADLFHLVQTLVGDSSDGYPGCKGIGPKKALPMLEAEKPKDMWAAVVAAFEAAGHDEEFALTQARLARILRTGDYNTKTGEIKLWEPKR